jgi:hypothetical protein
MGLIKFDFEDPIDVIEFMNQFVFNVNALYLTYITRDARRNDDYLKSSIEVINGIKNILTKLEEYKFGTFDNVKHIFYFNLKLFNGLRQMEFFTLITLDFDIVFIISQNPETDQSFYEKIQFLIEDIIDIKELYRAMGSFYNRVDSRY